MVSLSMRNSQCCEKQARIVCSVKRSPAPDVTDHSLQKFLDALQRGDLALVVALDRLARSTRDLLDILALISAKGATFKSLRESWADTATPYGELLVTDPWWSGSVRGSPDPHKNVRGTEARISSKG